jgi:hypothetical protein
MKHELGFDSHHSSRDEPANLVQARPGSRTTPPGEYRRAGSDSGWFDGSIGEFPDGKSRSVSRPTS